MTCTNPDCRDGQRWSEALEEFRVCDECEGGEVLAVSGSWGDPKMDTLDAALRDLLSKSDVSPEDQSSILHMLASDVDADAAA